MIARTELLRTIIDDPDSDTPRLVFADWIEEKGEPERAEFIRVQIKLTEIAPCNCYEFGSEHPSVKERIPKCEQHQKLFSLRKREKELLTPPRYDWLSCPSGFHGAWGVYFASKVHHGGWISKGGVPVKTIGANFHRGFVEYITCACNDWFTHHAAITAATPLRDVHLTTRPQIRVDESGIHLIGSSKRFTAEQVMTDLGTLSIDARMADKLLSLEWPRLKFTLPQYQYETVNDPQPRPEHRGASVGMRLPFGRD